MEIYHWISIAALAVSGVWIAQRMGLIDKDTAILGTIAAIAGTWLARDGSDTSETTDPRDEPVDDIPVDDRIDSADEIDQEVDDEMADSDSDPFDAALDVGG
jgi:hypothetical protein